MKAPICFGSVSASRSARVFSLGALLVAAFAHPLPGQAQPAPKAAPAAAPATSPTAAPTPAASAASRAALIAQVLQTAGVNDQLQLLSGAVHGGFKQGASEDRTRGVKLPPEAKARVARLEASMAEAFNPQLFLDRVTAALNEDYNEQRLRAVLAELDTPLAKRMTALEKQAPDPAALRQYVTQTRQQPLSQARLVALTRIDAASGGSEMATDVALSISRLMIYAAPGADPERARLAVENLEKRREAVLQQTRGNLLIMNGYTYRNASDEDLTAYAKALESENMLWVTRKLGAALVAQFKASGLKMADAFHTILQAGGAQAVAAQAGATPVAEPKPARPAPRALRPSTMNMDARECLGRGSSEEIMACAEKYR